MLGFEKSQAALWQKENGTEQSLNQIAKPQGQHQRDTGADMFGGGV
jgi:hypothetical protein